MPDLNRRLTTMDASFLYVERPTQPMHIAGCMVYDGHVSAQDIIDVLEERMHLLPRYRQKVVFPPFGLAHPTWEDDADFSVANHVDEVRLPARADDQVISEIGGEIHARMLDRDRPLWKIVALQGAADGNTRTVSMVHHAMVDGVSGVDLTMVMHDLTADAEPPLPPATPWQPEPIADPVTRMQEALRDRLTDAANFFADESFRFLRPEQVAQSANSFFNSAVRSFPALLRPAPRMPFNGTVSGRRQFVWAEFNFADVRFIRSVLGGTVNDVVLATIAGGLGRYLRAHDHKTDGVEVRAMCPVSMRREDERGALGNLVSLMIAPLFVGILDPLARLNAEREAMLRLKEQNQAQGFYAMTDLLNRVPPAWQATAMQFNVPQTLLNTVSTNVPGPQIPLYLRGHQLLQWIPLGPLASNVGLFNAILSYNQKITIAGTLDPTRMPDGWFYADCLKESFEEILGAAQKAAAAAEPPAPPPPAHVEVPAKASPKRRPGSRASNGSAGGSKASATARTRTKQRASANGRVRASRKKSAAKS
jgi:diacylglycerol O-acyltransferase / wax synthase